jgi:hypothetical protein
MYFLTVDYEEENIKSYKGVCIDKYENSKSEELVRSNAGDIRLDERRALEMLYDLVGEVRVVYSSSYDNYFMDLDTRLAQIAKAIRKLFKGNKNLKKCKVLGDFISLDFKDVNMCPKGNQDIGTYIEDDLLKAGIDLKSEGLTICYCDGNYVSIQKLVTVIPGQMNRLNFYEPDEATRNLYNKEVYISARH